MDPTAVCHKPISSLDSTRSIREMDTRPADVFTIGYEGRTVDDLVGELVANGVEVLVDVRLTPTSRKRGFSKRSLAEAVTASGIEYAHVPELGNPKDNRDGLHRRDPDALARYERVLDAAQPAIEALAHRSRASVIALLCFERDSAICHRSSVVDRLRTLTTLDVHHL